MQPAREEVVHHLTRPASAATTAARRGAMMSSPAWRPFARPSPQLPVSSALPTSGKTIGLTATERLGRRGRRLRPQSSLREG